MRAKIKTLGCRSNQYDSSKMEKQLLSYGIDMAGKDDDADLIIINSCTVTNLAERKSCQEVRKAVRIKDNSKIIIVTGCSTRTKDKKISNILGIDYVIEDYDLEKVLKNIIMPNKKNEKQDLVRVRSYIKIQDGCEDNCSYCIVPEVRGKARSKSIKEIEEEAKELIEKGAKELVITGINAGCYFYNGYTLKDIIKFLCSLNGLERLRLSSIEPQYFNDELMDVYASEPKVCSYFHIPIQSGSDEILQKMNRKYSINSIKKLVNKIRESKKDSFVSTDIIVGFPGENISDFEETIKIIKELNLPKIHTFRYSPRPGTPASNFPAQVNNKEKKKRAKILDDLSKELFCNYANSYLGKSLKVLIEQKKEGYFWGLTHNYLKVRLKDDNNYAVGDLINVKLSKLRKEHFDAEII